MRAFSPRMASGSTPWVARTMAVAVVLALLLTGAPWAFSAAPTADQSIAAGKTPPLVSVVCVKRTTGLMRAPKSTRCRGSEQRVKLQVHKPRNLCRTTSRQLFLVGKGKRLSVRECRTRGTVVKAPGVVRILVCRSSNGALRTIKGSQRCRKTETLARLRNAKPYDLTLSNDTVLDRAPAGTTVGSFNARDRNGDPLTWRMIAGVGSEDNAAFRLQGTSLRTTRAVDALEKRSYRIRVRVRDIGGRSRDGRFVIQVAPLAATRVTLSESSIPENAGANTVVGQLATMPAALTGTRYSLVSGVGDTHNGDFAIQGSDLLLSQSADHETAGGVRSVRVRSVDDRGVSVETQLTITITDVNEAPTAIALSRDLVDEHQPAGTVIGELTATDPDQGDTFTWQAAPAADFAIVGSSLVTKRPLSHVDSPLTVTLTATDSGNLTFSRTAAITVRDIVDAPTDLALTNAEVAEFGGASTVGTLSADHPDGSTSMVWEFVSGDGADNNGDFSITGSTLATVGALRQSDGRTRSIRVRVTASDGGTAIEVFNIAVTRTPQAPSNVGLSPQTVAENSPAGTVIGTLSATDANIDESATWELVPDAADNAMFTIDGDQLQVRQPLDHEQGTSRTVRVSVTDADGLSTQQNFTISVTNVDEAPSAPALSNAEVSEAQVDATVGTLSATDPEGASVSYTLPDNVGDNGEFKIQGALLITRGALDYADGATRTIRVLASDMSGNSTPKDFTITVLKDAQAPTDIALSANTVPENSSAGTAIGTLSTTDPNSTDAGLHTYEIVEETGDFAMFTLVGNELRTAGTWDYETAITRSVRIRTIDPDAKTFEKNFTIHLTDVNEAPTNLVLTGSVAVDGAADVSVGTFSATDVDAGDALTYHLVSGAGGEDNGDFVVEAATGKLRTNGALSRADGATRSIRVEARDAAGLSVSDTFTVDVEILPTAPSDITLSSSEVAENRPIGTVVGTLDSVDINAGDTFTYSIVGGTDAAAFQISGDELQTATSFNFEVKRSYQVTIRSTDSGTRTFDKTFTITVTDVNEAPTGLAPVSATVAENSPVDTVVATLSATDPEGAALTWSGAAAPFKIVDDELLLAGPVDFETQSSYQLTLQVSDGTHATVLALTVSVTNVNEAPHSITLSATEINENNAVGAVIGTLGASDPDAGDTRSWQVLAGRFTVLNGQLKAAAAFDHEASDSESVTVKVTDAGGLSETRTFSVTVNDVDEAPVAATYTYEALVGNVSAYRGNSAPSGVGPAQALRGTAVLANDSDPEGQPVRVQMPAGASELTRTTSLDGTVTIQADGQFRYTPKAGVHNAQDEFTYPVTDGTLTSTGTVKLNIIDRRIWFVDPSVPAPGLGTSAAPFASLASLQGSDPDDTDEEIFVSSGTHALPAAGFTLEVGQKLYGGAAGVQVGATQAEPAMNLIAPGAPSSLTGTGAGLVLAEKAHVSHLAVTSGTDATLAAASVNAATVNDTVTLTSGTGPAIAVTDGSGALVLKASVRLGTGTAGVPGVSIADRSGTTTLGQITTSTNSSGVSLKNAGTVVLGGVLQLATSSRAGLSVENTTLTANVGGHRISSTSGTPVNLTGGTLSAPLTFSRITSNGAVHGIKVIGTTGSPVVVASTEQAPSSIANSSDAGVLVEAATAPSLTSISVTNGAGDGVRVVDSVGAFSLVSSTITGNAEDQVQVSQARDTPGSVSVKSNTVRGGQHGILVSRDGSNWSGTSTFEVLSNTVSGSRGAGILVTSTGMPTTGGFNGSVGGNIVGNTAADSCSATGNGIEVANEAGVGVMRVVVASNVVQNCRLAGISVLTGDGNSAVSATITQNTVSSSTDLNRGYALNVIVGTTPDDAGMSCLNIRDNTFASAGTLTGLRLNSRWGVTNLPGYTGAANTPVAVEAYLGQLSTGTSTVTGQGFGSAGCPMP